MDHITKVDSNAKLHLAIFRQLSIPDSKFILDLHRTGNCVYDAGKFCQNIVPWRVHHSASVFLDNLGNYFPVHFNGADGGLIIFAHEAAVTFNICTENCGELTLEVFCSHENPPYPFFFTSSAVPPCANPEQNGLYLLVP